MDEPIDSENVDNTFAEEVLSGLSSEKKHLSCKYIYDNQGSELFQQIMRLPEYYPTDCEAEILDAYSEDIASDIEADSFTLIELGAGDGLKTRILLDHFLEDMIDFQYVPIDISQSAVEGLLADLHNDFEELNVHGLVAEYFSGLEYLSTMDEHVKLVLFLGSNIGNMKNNDAVDFLKHLHDVLNNGDYLLIGFDLKKDASVLNRAYNDSKGVTEAFNFNILERINRELGGNFDTERFYFYSTFDPTAGAVKSYLISTIEQDVYIKNLHRTFHFKKEEPLHTESSHKYSIEEIYSFAKKSGFECINNYYDNRNFFVDSLWKVVK